MGNRADNSAAGKRLSHLPLALACRVRFPSINAGGIYFENRPSHIRDHCVYGQARATPGILAEFRARITLVKPATLDSPVCRDRDDDTVLATAIAAQARVIVTGDDLLALKSPQGIAILTPRQFLEPLDGVV